LALESANLHGVGTIDFATHEEMPTIDHAEAYVRGTVHTNGLENFWSLLKRAIKGTYVSIEPFHLFRYLDEEAYRFNTRQGEGRGALRGYAPRRSREARQAE
jgi:hypothetical protein